MAQSVILILFWLICFAAGLFCIAYAVTIDGDGLKELKKRKALLPLLGYYYGILSAIAIVVGSLGMSALWIVHRLMFFVVETQQLVKFMP